MADIAFSPFIQPPFSFKAKALAVNLNTTNDVTSFLGLPNNIVLDRVEISNWSTTPSVLLTATLRDASAGGGNSLVGSIAGLNSLVASAALAAVAVPLSATLGVSRVVSTNSHYLNVSVANGTPLTADVAIYYHLV